MENIERTNTSLVSLLDKTLRVKTFTANSDGNYSEDSDISVSLKEHLSKMESLLNDKLGKLDGKIGALTLYEATFFLFSRSMTASKQR